MSSEADHDHVIDTGKGEFALSELGHLMPGMAEIMPLVGGRILSGTIKRGDGERLAAALWYSDLRNSTGLADQLPVDAFLDLLNAYSIARPAP